MVKRYLTSAEYLRILNYRLQQHPEYEPGMQFSECRMLADVGGDNDNDYRIIDPSGRKTEVFGSVASNVARTFEILD